MRNKVLRYGGDLLRLVWRQSSGFTISCFQDDRRLGGHFMQRVHFIDVGVFRFIISIILISRQQNRRSCPRFIFFFLTHKDIQFRTIQTKTKE